jgi:hydrogenase-4 component F
MIATAKESHHILAMIGAILLLLILLSIIFYRFVAIYQAMKYEGVEEEKEVYTSELFALIIFALATATLLLPASEQFLKGIV